MILYMETLIFMTLNILCDYIPLLLKMLLVCQLSEIEHYYYKVFEFSNIAPAWTGWLGMLNLYVF